MNTKVHIWLANPQSLSEVTEMLRSVEMALPESGGDIFVVCEKKLLEISDLIPVLPYSEDGRQEILDAAKARGIAKATALFGLQTKFAVPTGPYPAQVTYLGGFALDEVRNPIDDWDHIPLYRAVYAGDTAEVERILKSNPESIRERNPVGHTPLMVSATKERPEIMELLLKAGARIDDVTPEDGLTPLHWALSRPPRNPQCVLKIVGTLISHGSDINAREYKGLTPLMLAAWFGAKNVVAFLLECGADPSITEPKGRTARDIAFQRSHSEIAAMFQ